MLLLNYLFFGIGAVFGIKVFSKVLNWMFEYHKNLILSILTGFMVGALNKIWPWKEVLQYRLNHDGEKTPFIERSILPNHYTEDPQIIYAILFMIIGFLSIFILEKLSSTKNN